MRFAHISDLHIGKRVNEFSMLEDQRVILNQILNIVDTSRVNGVIIAGDVYDKSTPSAEAVALFDEFLVSLSKRDLSIFLISGNHDSGERLAFGGRILKESGIYISPVYNGEIAPVTLSDDYGEINVYLLPFIKPSNVRKYADTEINSYTDAVKYAIDKMNIDTAKRNILVTHQFVTGAQRCESEEICVGGSDGVDASIMQDFDYVALGHIHKPQCCTSERIRYCGTPLKYSFSESRDKKCVTVFEIKEKGSLEIEEHPLKPMRDLVEIKGTYEELMQKSYYEGTTLQNDYVHITLTDEQDVPDAISRLRIVYKNLMKLDYDNKRTRAAHEIDGAQGVEVKTPLELLCELYLLQNDEKMSSEQTELAKDAIERIWGQDV